jgi:hypothetical protein
MILRLNFVSATPEIVANSEKPPKSPVTDISRGFHGGKRRGRPDSARQSPILAHDGPGLFCHSDIGYRQGTRRTGRDGVFFHFTEIDR